jgi:PAS domain S-box-containing protein
MLRAVALIAAAILVNLVLGRFVQTVLQWPLFLDAIGTIAVGALLGPLAGAATGILTNVLGSVIQESSTYLPYAITSAFIGWAAGYAAYLGAFKRWQTVLLTGLLVGIGSALISAPITAYIFGGVTGRGGDYLNAYLTAAGHSLLQAATIEGFIRDPVDKMVSFMGSWLLYRLLQPYFPPLTQHGAGALESLSGYTLAVAVSLLALLISFVFLPAAGPSIFAVFMLAVLLSAWRGGMGPALLTTAIGALSYILLLLSPYYQEGTSATDWFQVVIFTIVSLSIAGIANRLEQSRRNLQISLQAERESEARIQAVTDSVKEALVMVSRDQRVSAVNRTYTELFGVPVERLIGQRIEDTRTMFDQVFDDSDALFNTMLAITAETDQPNTGLVKQKWPQPRELELYSTPVRSGDGYLGRLFVLRDVTHEREVDRMKTEFVSMVSHELRTPLTAIKGFSEMVLDGDAGEINEEAAEYIRIVFNNAERLVALVNDLLDLSRLESGRVQLKSERVDLGDVVQNVVLMMEQKVEEKNQQLTVKIDPDATAVIGDNDKLVQIVTNYVSNAYKYTQAGGSIRVEVTRQDSLARLAVVDNGYGIAPEDQTRLFTRFYRVDNSMTREVGGTGLGLSIVKQMIEMQGGEVGVTSALGQGSTFWFTIPLAPLVQAAAPAESPTPIEKAPSLPPQADILVIEDNLDVAHLIALHLEKAGYYVTIAQSAEEALKTLAQSLPDLITLDIELPGMQGDELAQHLRADPRTADIPVLIISAFAKNLDGVQFGAYVLPKPIDQNELLATVARLLESAQSGPVLLIDDDSDVRALLKTALEEQGLAVEVAEDGEQGLKQVAAQRPGLILLDMRLPDMDGFALLKSLKATPATADIPVIALTGSGDLKTEARARVLALGGTDLISMPIDADRLVAEVKLFLPFGIHQSTEENHDDQSASSG